MSIREGLLETAKGVHSGKYSCWVDCYEPSFMYLTNVIPDDPEGLELGCYSPEASVWICLLLAEELAYESTDVV